MLSLSARFGINWFNASGVRVKGCVCFFIIHLWMAWRSKLFPSGAITGSNISSCVMGHTKLSGKSSSSAMSSIALASCAIFTQNRWFSSSTLRSAICDCQVAAWKKTTVIFHECAYLSTKTTSETDVPTIHGNHCALPARCATDFASASTHNVSESEKESY